MIVGETIPQQVGYTIRETMVADAVFIAHAKEDITYLLEQLEIFLGE